MRAQTLNGTQAARANQAFLCLRAGDAAGALRIAQELVSLAPQAPDAQQLLALSLAECGDIASAEQAFRVALRLAPAQPAIVGNLARLLRRSGRPEAALEVWQQAARAAPGLAVVQLELGLVALELGRHEMAIAALRVAVDRDPKLARGWHGLGNALRSSGELDAAEAAFRAALALQPESQPVLINLAAVLRLLGRPEESVAVYASARALGPANPELLDAMVGSLLDAMRVGEAMALAKASVDANPQYIPSQVTLADLLWEYGPADGQEGDPLARFRASAAAMPGNHDLQLALIGFLLEAKQCDEALERLQQLRRQVDHPNLVALQANALELLDRPAESAPLYAQAHRALGGSDLAFLCAYVRHLLKSGEWKQAAAYAQDALRIQSDYQEAWAYLATAWRLLGDPREFWLCDYERMIDSVAIEVPKGFTDMPQFLAALEASLEVLHHARIEPVRQSLRGGSQTPGRLFGRTDPNITVLKPALLRTIESWIARLPTAADHPFLRRAARSVRFTGSWSVKLRRSGSHVNHYHNEGWMSSAFYVSLPPSVRDASGTDPHAGCIQFGQPPVELGLGLPPRRVIRPQAGHLALFPSYMWHGTIPFDDAHPRLTVAFDMQPIP